MATKPISTMTRPYTVYVPFKSAQDLVLWADQNAGSRGFPVAASKGDREFPANWSNIPKGAYVLRRRPLEKPALELTWRKAVRDEAPTKPGRKVNGQARPYAVILAFATMDAMIDWAEDNLPQGGRLYEGDTLDREFANSVPKRAYVPRLLGYKPDSFEAQRAESVSV